MEPDSLREQLSTLHRELGAAESVDPGSARLLGELMEDIKRLIEHAPPAAVTPDTPVTPVPPASLTDRLERLAVQFEADHPTLAASSRRLVDLLGKVGV